jgi:DNA-binding transcriptional regulator YhcF (GntR family)
MDNVAFKATTQDAKGKTIDVPRGSVCASYRHIADETGVGLQVVRTAIKRFETEHMVNTKVTHGKTVVSLCNYEKHQRSENEPNTTLTQDQHKPNTQKKQGNKVTTEEPKGSLSPTAKKTPLGSRLSQDWVLSKSLGDWSMNKGASDDLTRAEADRFKDYWIGVAGAKGRKADWDATWRNWIRKAIADNHKPQLKAISGGRDERRQQGSAVNNEIAARFANGTFKHDPFQ